MYMTPADKTFIQEKSDEKSVIVRYLITSPLAPESAAVKLCKEQSLSNALGIIIHQKEAGALECTPNII